MFHTGRRTALLAVAALAAAPASLYATGHTAPTADHASAVTPKFAGVVRGRVTERESGQPVASAQVVIVGTTIGAVSDQNGNYAIRGVPAGQVTVRFSRIGYTPVSQTATVVDNGEVTVNFQVERAAARLEEVVTTATGEQSRREFGNVVATVKADSVMQAAPVTNINELLQARTPGVQIVQGWGQVGSSASVRIRGASSLSLTNEPLIIVDGVRYDNAPESANFSSVRVNRFNINPDDIESIDLIKGPSAAALYGTAAANGVVLIKTKHGQVGAPEWSARAEYGLMSNPGGFPANYWSWGQNINSSGVRVGNPGIQCKLTDKAAGRCLVDSVTSYNPWIAPETDPFSTTPRYLFGGQVAGGTEALRYFLSAERENEVGPYTMPQAERDRITTERNGVGPRDTEIHPNQLAANSFRGNFQVNVRPNLTFDINSGYSRRNQYNAFEGTFFAGMTFQFLTGKGTKNTGVNGLQREYVGDIFGVENQLRTDRFTGSAGMNWQPYNWLTARAVVGLDQNNTFGYRLQYRGEGPRVGLSWGPNGREGGIDYERTNASRYTTDLGATATYNLTPTLSTRTSLGAQMFFDGQYRSQGEGYGLPPGASSPNSARLRQSWEFTTEEKTYGAFLEEQVGWRDRLFVTVGGRTDQNSAFGRSVGNTFYPRAAVSWVASEEGWFPKIPTVSRLRLRSAFGKAGVQPSTIAALQYLGAAAFPAGAAADEPGLRLADLGNINLKPEVTTEYEGGADIGFFNDRVNLEATMFRKISHDALFQRPLAPSVGTSIGAASPQQWVNIAEVQNQGIELAIDTRVINTRPFSWDLRLNGSHLRNKLVNAGDVQLSTAPGERNVVGYPLFGLWDRKILSYNDANNDGIISDAELVVSDTQYYRGSTLPEYEAGINNTVGFFNDAFQISTLFDYRGNFWKRWRYEEWRCQSSSNCQGLNDPSASFEQQAASAAAISSGKRTVWGYYLRNDFIKFRELSFSYRFPQSFVNRYMHGRSTSVVVAGRNLGYLWSKYKGVDPESNGSVANTGGGNTDLTAQPPIRVWTARLNFAF